jgi:hypothetical protein
MRGFLGVAPYRGYALALGFTLVDFDLAKFRFVIGKCLGENSKQVLCMLGSDTYNRLCTRLVYPWDLVEKDKGEFVVFVSDLDHVAVDRIEVLRNIDSNLIL